MTRLRKALLIISALVLIAVAWVWWNRPQRVEMSSYVPADSLIYLEANSLPEIAGAIVSTDAWRALAPAAGIKSNFGQVGWVSRLVAWTGIGPADSVALSRAQVAVTVMGLDAADAGETLKIKPLYALVVETHTSESRTRAAVEKRVGDFARSAYGEPRIERREADGAAFTVWSSPDGTRRIITAVIESVAVIGNDEGVVQACLAVRRGERPSLADNPQLGEMRRRVGGDGEALAFGYISPAGASRLLEVAATAYAGQVSSDPRAQSAAASLLPPLAKKILGDIGWSSHAVNGAIEDRYFLSVQNGVTARLQTAFASANDVLLSSSGLLPAGTYSVSRYNYRDPDAAWRGLNDAISSQLDVTSSYIFSRLLEASLKPYGIEEPGSFLRAIGPEIVTARLDDSGSSTVTVVEVRDEKTLRDFVAKRFGPKTRAESIGDAEILIANNEKRDAASFVAGHLIMGTETNVRRCLEGRVNGRTLASAETFLRASGARTASVPANVVTFTADDAPARSFIMGLAAQRGTRDREPNEEEFNRALGRLLYAVSETQLVNGGFEKRTRSSFGQFGALAAQFASVGS
ncbi:MAG TPA: hypothetical protein VF723_09935 [Pyrinomonadaceae bacterium]|jgi:hypothetical protein